MRTASRHMPKYQPRRIGWFGWLLLVLVLALLAGWGVAALFRHPIPTLVAIIAASAFVALGSRHHRSHASALRQLADSRDDQTICNFAREFDLREVDPWVVRAVYEQLQELLRDVYPSFPVKADDKLIGGLIFDPDDLDMQLVHEIEKRTGRVLKRFAPDPDHGKVSTVRDLVLLFNAQSLAPAT